MFVRWDMVRKTKWEVVDIVRRAVKKNGKDLEKFNGKG